MSEDRLSSLVLIKVHCRMITDMTLISWFPILLVNSREELDFHVCWQINIHDLKIRSHTNYRIWIMKNYVQWPARSAQCTLELENSSSGRGLVKSGWGPKNLHAHRIRQKESPPLLWKRLFTLPMMNNYGLKVKESILLHYGLAYQHYGVHDLCYDIHVLEASVLAVCGHVAKPQVQ